MRKERREVVFQKEEEFVTKNREIQEGKKYVDEMKEETEGIFTP